MSSKENEAKALSASAEARSLRIHAANLKAEGYRLIARGDRGGYDLVAQGYGLEASAERLFSELERVEAIEYSALQAEIEADRALDEQRRKEHAALMARIVKRAAELGIDVDGINDLLS